MADEKDTPDEKKGELPLPPEEAVSDYVPPPPSTSLDLPESGPSAILPAPPTVLPQAVTATPPNTPQIAITSPAAHEARSFSLNDAPPQSAPNTPSVTAPPQKPAAPPPALDDLFKPSPLEAMTPGDAPWGAEDNPAGPSQNVPAPTVEQQRKARVEDRAQEKANARRERLGKAPLPDTSAAQSPSASTTNPPPMAQTAWDMIGEAGSSGGGQQGLADVSAKLDQILTILQDLQGRDNTATFG